VNVEFVVGHCPNVAWISENLKSGLDGMFAYYYYSATSFSYLIYEDLSTTKYISNAIILTRRAIFGLDAIFWNKGYSSISLEE